MEKILNQILNEIQSMNTRMGSIENRMVTMDKRMETMENRMETMDKSMETLENRIGTMENRMESMEDRLESMDNRISNLEIGQNGMKTDIKEIKHKVNVINDQTALLTEFRTKTNEKLDKISEDIEFLKYEEYQTKQDIFKIKKRFDIIR